MYNFNNALIYLTEHPDKNIIIEILSLDEEREGRRVCPAISRMQTLQMENNIIYDFYSIDDLLTYGRLCDHSVPNYKYFHHFPVSTWGMARVLLEAKVSDMVLGEPLLFMEKEVNKYIHPYVTTRAYPHKGKPSLALEFDSLPAIHHFFGLPQYNDLYTHIDVFELLDDNIVRESALIDTYNQPTYIYRLNHLIPSITSNVTGAFIDESFMTKRLNCGQVCMKSANSCHYCKNYEHMYEVVSGQAITNVSQENGES